MTGLLQNKFFLILLTGILLRIIFWIPYYLPVDTFSYLNGILVFDNPYMGEIIHVVRIGMVFPLFIIEYLCGKNLILSSAYILFLSIGTIWLTIKLANRWGGEDAAFLAGLIVAFVPMEVVYGSVILPDTPLSFFSLAAFALIVCSDSENHKSNFCLAGILLGLAYTCKVTALFFMPCALLQAIFSKQGKSAVCYLTVGFTLIFTIEHLTLFFLMGDWHIRIAETLGFVSGAKGNYMQVDKTFSWWLGQIWFKVGALFWGKHLPTLALLGITPHIVFIAIWRMRLSKWTENSRWLALWGGTWVLQQLLISAIEQEPRYFQAAIPYFAIIVGLSFAELWNQLDRLWKTVLTLTVCIQFTICSWFFWATYSPMGAAVSALSVEFDKLAEKEGVLIDGLSEYEIRLASYRGLNTVANKKESNPTHWAAIHNGYTAKYSSNMISQDNMEIRLNATYKSPLSDLFRNIDYNPGVGSIAEAQLYEYVD